MLHTVKDTASIGPNYGEHHPGEHMVFALDHGLLKRSDIGNLMLSPKAEELLSGNLDWETL